MSSQQQINKGNESKSIPHYSIKSRRLKFYKQSAEKFVSRIDPEAFSASGSRVIFPVACHDRFKSSATKRGEDFHSNSIWLFINFIQLKVRIM